MTDYPSLLILGNDCLSQVTANGRTLGNFLQGWPREKIAQFCVHGTAPDKTVCENYYCVSDRAATLSFFRGKPAPRQNLAVGVALPRRNFVSKRRKRNAATMLLRNRIWNSMRWAGPEFDRWLADVAPELILLQAGDCAFMLRLARELKERFDIPLVIYNSEGCYFKAYDYFRSGCLTRLAFPRFRREFCLEFEKTMAVAAKAVYCCEKLKQDYDAVFSTPSQVLHTATQLRPDTVAGERKSMRISYLGNLGLGRHESLVEIGDALHRISPELKLDIYGKIPDAQVSRAFSACPGIRYRGFVSYEEVRRLMAESDILIHAESFAEFSREDLKYGFSTKIADTLAVGRCFLLYAPETIACSEYLRKYDAAWVVSNKETLFLVLRDLCGKPELRMRFAENGRRLAEKNHSWEKNAQRFQQILLQQCEAVP